MIKGVHLHFPQLVFYNVILIFTLCCDAELAIKFVINNNGFGAYSFEYQTADGTYRTEDGGLVTGHKGDALVVRGEYGYIDTNGKPYSLKYVADINGYQPETESKVRFNNRRII